MVAGSIDASFSTGATAATATAATTTDPRLLGEAILTDIVIVEVTACILSYFCKIVRRNGLVAGTAQGH